MLRTTFRTLLQPRYAALTIVMVFVALGCVGAGTWQIARFEQKVHANDALTANAHAAPVPARAVLPPVGAAQPPADAVRYRPVTATGSYDRGGQGLVRLRSVNDQIGFYVLTPLTTDSGTLLVVRGFVTALPDGQPPTTVADPPAGRVSVLGWAQPGEPRKDVPTGLPRGQLAAINPADQAARLGTEVYDGYVLLDPGQPGTAGLTAIPAPDLSNPAGGAVEPQHFAYIVQWYLFAVLALAAPVAMSRAERREQDRDAGDDAAPAQPAPPGAAPPGAAPPGAAPPGAAPDELSDADRRARKLADRYGRQAV